MILVSAGMINQECVDACCDLDLQVTEHVLRRESNATAVSEVVSDVDRQLLSTDHRLTVTEHASYATAKTQTTKTLASILLAHHRQ